MKNKTSNEFVTLPKQHYDEIIKNSKYHRSKRKSSVTDEDVIKEGTKKMKNTVLETKEAKSNGLISGHLNYQKKRPNKENSYPSKHFKESLNGNAKVSYIRDNSSDKTHVNGSILSHKKSPSKGSHKRNGETKNNTKACIGNADAYQDFKIPKSSRKLSVSSDRKKLSVSPRSSRKLSATDDIRKVGPSPKSSRKLSATTDDIRKVGHSHKSSRKQSVTDDITKLGPSPKSSRRLSATDNIRKSSVGSSPKSSRKLSATDIIRKLGTTSLKKGQENSTDTLFSVTTNSVNGSKNSNDIATIDKIHRSVQRQTKVVQERPKRTKDRNLKEGSGVKKQNSPKKTVQQIRCDYPTIDKEREMLKSSATKNIKSNSFHEINGHSTNSIERKSCLEVAKRFSTGTQTQTATTTGTQTAREPFVTPQTINEFIPPEITPIPTNVNCSTGETALRKKLQKISRKDLEDMIIQQFVEKIFTDHELGNQRDLCNRLEETLVAVNKKARCMTKEIQDLKAAVQKVTAEHENRKNVLVMPFKMKRSVGIQVTEARIQLHLQPQPAIDVPTLPQGTNEVKRNTPESGDQPQNQSNVIPLNKSQDSYNRDDLITLISQSQKSQPTVNSQTETPDVDIIEEDLIILTDAKKTPSPPIGVPATPLQESKLIPPKPMLKVSRKKTTVDLSWNLDQSLVKKPISSFQLILMEESLDKLTKKDLIWRKIGSVKALNLPMSCTLTEFRKGHVYHFSVRALDNQGLIGPYAYPRTVELPFD